MISAVAPAQHTLHLNTRLFRNALTGVDAASALRRPSPDTNHIAFVACHLVEARHFLARALGDSSESPFRDLLENARGIEEVREFPSLDAIRTAWDEVSERLSARLATLTSEDLERPVDPAFPIENGGTLLGCLTFLVHHDTYHLGQLAFLRRFLGLPAMSYR